MCFYVTKGDKAKIAKENITVYKVIRIDNSPIYGDLIINRKREFWKKGFHYIETNFPKVALTLGISKNSFHSYMTLFQAQNFKFGSSHIKVVEMIIPKGAYYYKNENHQEYISSDIIYIKDI